MTKPTKIPDDEEYGSIANFSKTEESEEGNYEDFSFFSPDLISLKLSKCNEKTSSENCRNLEAPSLPKPLEVNAKDEKFCKNLKELKMGKERDELFEESDDYLDIKVTDEYDDLDNKVTEDNTSNNLMILAKVMPGLMISSISSK